METNKFNPFDSLMALDNDKIVKNIRISLAYGQFEDMPNEILATSLTDQIQFLDISHNSFKNLTFLEHFPALRTLILDRNFNLDCNSLPMMKNLQILWLNNCNLINITDWIHKLQTQCPNLTHLSMMCNPVGQTILNGVTDAEEHAYRKQIIKLLPQLKHFDGMAISKKQRRTSQDDSVLSLSLLENVFRQKLYAFWSYSTRRLHSQFTSNKVLTIR